MSKTMQVALLLGNLQAENSKIPPKNFGWLWGQIVSGLEHNSTLAEKAWIKLQEMLWRHQPARMISKSEMDLNKIIDSL